VKGGSSSYLFYPIKSKYVQEKKERGKKRKKRKKERGKKNKREKEK
jgi:hypothetical protein